MRRQGLRAFEQRIERKSKLYSYEQPRAAQLTEPELRRFRRNKAAWTWFERLAPSRRRAMFHWIACAKRPDTRARRLDKLIGSSASGVGLMP